MGSVLGPQVTRTEQWPGGAVRSHHCSPGTRSSTAHPGTAQPDKRVWHTHAHLHPGDAWLCRWPQDSRALPDRHSFTAARTEFPHFQTHGTRSGLQII